MDRRARAVGSQMTAAFLPGDLVFVTGYLHPELILEGPRLYPPDVVAGAPPPPVGDGDLHWYLTLSAISGLQWLWFPGGASVRSDVALGQLSIIRKEA
jgi:hypothetical protein